MCTKKKTGTSNLNCSKKNMREFFNNEDWKEDPNDTLPTLEGIKRDIESMDFKELKAFKLKTQTNLAKATLQNRNTALEFGVPVASLVFSVISILFSIRLAEPTSYDILDQKVEPILSKGISCTILAAMFLCVCTIAALLILIICQSFCKKRKHEVFYYQTLLNVIASIEEEWEHSNRYDVSVRNTETGENNQYDAYLLPKNR